jgi:hypothetical protein
MVLFSCYLVMDQIHKWCIKYLVKLIDNGHKKMYDLT